MSLHSRISTMDKRANRFLWIGVIWLSLTFAIYYFLLARPGIGTKWEQEQVPPEQVSVLRLGAHVEILAQTPGGNLYELVPGWNGLWKKVTEPLENPEPLLICYPDDSDGYLILTPPGKVTSRVSEYCVATESGHHIEVVLLENGEVWSWRHEVGGHLSIVLILVLCVAFVLGLPFLIMGLRMKIRDWVKLQK